MAAAPWLTPSGGASGLEAMIDDFYQQAWAEAHERFTEDVSAGLARLARWLRPRANAEDEIPAVTPGGDRRNDRAIRAGGRQGAEASGEGQSLNAVAVPEARGTEAGHGPRRQGVAVPVGRRPGAAVVSAPRLGPRREAEGQGGLPHLLGPLG